MIEFIERSLDSIEIHADDSHVMDLLQLGSRAWMAFFVFECPEEGISSTDIREIADKLDKLNKEPDIQEAG